MKKVTIEFLYDEVKGKDDDYYKIKAFDEIYNSWDCISYFEVEDIGE
jgi:hypothetical protein